MAGPSCPRSWRKCKAVPTREGAGAPVRKLVTSPYAPDPIVVYRIAVEAPAYGAEDLSGEGAKRSGGRWNTAGIPAVYASRTRALACLETVVHLTSAASLPMNRYLVEIELPAAAWAARVLFGDPSAAVGWDAEPAGRISIQWGSYWLTRADSLLAEVPSAIVPEETNILINPAHSDIAAVTARMIRKWIYDRRLRAAH